MLDFFIIREGLPVRIVREILGESFEEISGRFPERIIS